MDAKDATEAKACLEALDRYFPEANGGGETFAETLGTLFRALLP